MGTLYYRSRTSSTQRKYLLPESRRNCTKGFLTTWVESDPHKRFFTTGVESDPHKLILYYRSRVGSEQKGSLLPEPSLIRTRDSLLPESSRIRTTGFFTTGVESDLHKGIPYCLSRVGFAQRGFFTTGVES